jgi:hypothetical protein
MVVEIRASDSDVRVMAVWDMIPCNSVGRYQHPFLCLEDESLKWSLGRSV